jgi:hypothetical protein
MLYAVTLLFFVTGSVAQSRAEWKDDARPTHSSLIAIAKWVSANAGLPMMTNLPGVELVPLAELTRRREKGLASFYTGAALAAAGYDDATRTIYLPETGATNRRPTSLCWCMRWCITCRTRPASNTPAMTPARSRPMPRRTSGSGRTD